MVPVAAVVEQLAELRGMYSTVYSKVECCLAGLTWLRDSVAGTSSELLESYPE